MSNVMEYIRKYGDRSFCDMPFGEADNVALCGMYYMPFEKAVSDSFDDEPVPFAKASDDIFELRGRKHEPVGLILLKNISEQMVEMSKYKRFQEMKGLPVPEFTKRSLLFSLRLPHSFCLTAKLLSFSKERMIRLLDGRKISTSLPKRESPLTTSPLIISRGLQKNSTAIS